MKLPLSLQIAVHYLAARLRQTWSAERLRLYQEHRARQMVRFAYEHSPFYRAHWAGCDLANWRALPPVDKRLMMANFDRFTTRGVRADAAMQLALRAERERDFRPTLNGLTVGLSSGTSGHRGLFVVSPAEQAAWAGTILARVLPGLHPRPRQSTTLPPHDANGSKPSASALPSTALLRRDADAGEPPAAQQSAALPPRGAVSPNSVPVGGYSATVPRGATLRPRFGALPKSAPRAASGSVAGPAWRGYRVAFFLRSNSNLYEQTSGRLVRFRYFDLMLPLADAVAGLNAFQPDIIVGPPSLLERLAACHSPDAAEAAPAQQSTTLPQGGADGGARPVAAPQSSNLPHHSAVNSIGVPAGKRSAVGPPGATLRPRPRSGAVPEFGDSPRCPRRGLPMSAPSAASGSVASLPLLRCTPELLISVAEVLEPQVAAAIAEAFQAPVRQVYQCTEGLLAVSCAHGALHIQEDLVALQLEPLPEEGISSPPADVADLAAADGRSGVGRRFTPIVTDLHRSTQPIIRYRLGDVLQLDPNPCPCGSAFRVIRCIEGRADDILYFEPLATDRDPSGGAPLASALRPFYPDTLRRAVLLADGAIADYQVFQNADRSLCVRLAVAPGADFACVARGVRESIASTLAHYHCRMVRLAIEEGLAALPPGAKRRRVQRLG